MFNNIGGKIKTVAQVICWLGIIGSIILGIATISEVDETLGILIILLGPLFSWISSFITYGFGQLIENSDILVEQGKKGEYTTSHIVSSIKALSGEAKPTATASKKSVVTAPNTVIEKPEKICPNCKQPISTDSAFCTKCGFNLSEETAKNICPSCGNIITNDSAFCTQCGCRILK